MSRFFNFSIKINDILEGVSYKNSNCFNPNLLISSISDNQATSTDSICEYIKGPLPNNKDNLVVICEEELDGYTCVVVNNVKESVFKILNNINTLGGFKKFAHINRPYYQGNNVKIEEGVSFGVNCKLEDNVIIKSGTIIGDNCLIRANSVIGSKGFNHTKLSNGLVPTDSLGGVTIGNNVEVGYNSVIARGNIDGTIISDNVKIDALCLVSHDCFIGQNASLAASVTLCGYVEVGNDSRLAPNSTVLQRIKIGANVTVGLGAVVISNLKDNGVYFGNPAMKTKSKLIT